MRAGQLFSSIAPWLGALAGLVIVGFGVLIWVRRVLRNPSGGARPGFTLQDLREMRDAGAITAEEFERAREAMLQRLRSTSENIATTSRHDPDSPDD
jgi:Short C-terminal domain